MSYTVIRTLTRVNIVKSNPFNFASSILNEPSFRSYSKKKSHSRVKLPPSSKIESKWVSRVKDKNNILENIGKRLPIGAIVDSVWLIDKYEPQKYKIEEAIQLHLDLAQESMLNNLDGFITAHFILNMATNKKGKYLDNFKGSAYMPNYYNDGIKKEVVAICKKEDEIKAAKESGAIIAGHTEVLKMFEQGEISEQNYDFVVCTPETYPEVMLIKKKINPSKLPMLNSKTVTENVGDAVKELHLSKEFTTSKLSDSIGIIKARFGTMNMGVDKLKANFESLIKSIVEFRRVKTDDFVTECVLLALPSTEKFKIDVSCYQEVTETDNDKATRNKSKKQQAQKEIEKEIDEEESEEKNGVI